MQTSTNPDPEKAVSLPCRKYFEDRLIFFLDCKYWANSKYDPNTEEMLDKSIMRAAVELKAYEYSIEMMEKEGIRVVIEERVFQPCDLKPKVEELPNVDVSVSYPESSGII